MTRAAESRVLPSLLAAALAAPLAAGCSSSPPTQEAQKPATTTDKAPAKPSPEAQPKDDGQLESITIKKGDKRNPEAAYLDKPDPGNVSIDFRNADLGKIVLPLFSKQAGVTVEYAGTPRNVSSLRLVNAPWRDALDYICRFTGTHAVASQIRGRIELKLGASPSKPFLDKFDPNDKGGVELSGGSDTAASGEAPSATAPASSPSTASSGSSGSTTSPEPGSGEIADPNAKGKETIEKLRTGVSTTNSGQ